MYEDCPLSGKFIGDYRIEKQIGIGTVGSVYAATHPESGEVVALKLLHPEFAESPRVRQRFVREVSVLNKLRHENIVEKYSSGLHEDILYYTMEMVECGTLKDVLRGPFPWREATEVAEQICIGLQYLHDNDVIHRDLKPANLFLSDDGNVKIGDFSIARDMRSTRLTTDGARVGTLRYMSPEQIAGAPNIDPRLDLYALGCILYEMLTGHVPFDGDSDIELFNRHTTFAVKPVHELVGDCPSDLSQLVTHLLQKDPKDRPTSAASVQKALHDIRARTMTPDGDELVETAKAEPSGADANVKYQPNLTERLQAMQHSIGDNVSWQKLAVLFFLFLLVVIILSLVNHYTK